MKSSVSDFQEYPPGIIIIPMGSKTAKPYRTTNLVVFASESSHDNCGDHSFIAHGDALIIDPGCRSELHKEVLCVKFINLSCEFDGLLQNHACLPWHAVHLKAMHYLCENHVNTISV